jgi:hypothetical protein
MEESCDHHWIRQLKLNGRHSTPFCEKCGVVNESPFMKRLREAGLLGCLNGSGVTSENYKDILMDLLMDRDQEKPPEDRSKSSSESDCPRSP